MKYPPLLDDHYQFEFNFFYAPLEEKNALRKWTDESFLPSGSGRPKEGL